MKSIRNSKQLVFILIPGDERDNYSLDLFYSIHEWKITRIELNIYYVKLLFFIMIRNSHVWHWIYIGVLELSVSNKSSSLSYDTNLFCSSKYHYFTIFQRKFIFQRITLVSNNLKKYKAFDRSCLEIGFSLSLLF